MWATSNSNLIISQSVNPTVYRDQQRHGMIHGDSLYTCPFKMGPCLSQWRLVSLTGRRREITEKHK